MGRRQEGGGRKSDSRVVWVPVLPPFFKMGGREIWREMGWWTTFSAGMEDGMGLDALHIKRIR